MLIEEGNLIPGSQAAFLRTKLAEDHVGGDLLGEYLLKQPCDDVLSHASKAHARASGQLHVEDRFFGAKSHAANLYEVGFLVVGLEECTHGRQRLACAGTHAAGARSDEDDRLGDRFTPQGADVCTVALCVLVVAQGSRSAAQSVEQCGLRPLHGLPAGAGCAGRGFRIGHASSPSPGTRPARGRVSWALLWRRTHRSRRSPGPGRRHPCRRPLPG